MQQPSEKTLTETIAKLFSEGHTRKEVEAMLAEDGNEEFHINKLIDEYISLRNNRKRAIGMLLIVAGAIVCFASCVLTISASSVTESSWGLFGLTSIGVALVFSGLIYVFS